MDAAKSLIRVKPDQPQADQFIGRVVHFRNDLRRTAHTVVSATREGDAIALTTSDDLLVGRARVDEVSDRTLTTKTALPLAPAYRGTMLVSAAFEPLARVATVSDGKITLATALSEQHRPSRGDDVWLVNVGVGDTFELPALVDVSR
jgi:hypothetical protein